MAARGFPIWRAFSTAERCNVEDEEPLSIENWANVRPIGRPLALDLRSPRVSPSETRGEGCYLRDDSRSLTITCLRVHMTSDRMMTVAEVLQGQRRGPRGFVASGHSPSTPRTG